VERALPGEVIGFRPPPSSPRAGQRGAPLRLPLGDYAVDAILGHLDTVRIDIATSRRPPAMPGSRSNSSRRPEDAGSVGVSADVLIAV
jgi:hypothetical protein